MTKTTQPIGIIFFGLLLLPMVATFAWAEEPRLSLAPEPIRYTYVHGDVEKFQAHRWFNDRYAGGIKDLSLHYNDESKGIESSAEGHAIIDNNDIEGVLTAKQKDKGFVKVDYSSFRKYYDGTGGTFKPFSQFRAIDLERPLQLDIAKFEVEAGLTIPEWPELTFAYEREEKGGTKSRLTWSSVREASIIRKTSPSWQEIDETVNVFTVKAHKEVAGFDLHGEQEWELVRADTTRYEQQFSDTATASDKKIRLQDQEPQANATTTTLGMEKWFWDGKAFVSSGYRHGFLDNKEIENIYETDASGKIQSFANAENVRNALAYNKFETHTWVSSFMANPWKWLNSILRLKTEVYRQKGSSSYPKDSTPTTPDGLINTIDESGVSNKVLRLGEGISLRYTGIPHAALYSDLEFEQVKDLIQEDRTSIGIQSAQNVGEILSRITATYVRRGIGKIGGRVSPWSFMDLTAEVSHRQNNNDYDDRMETDGSASQGKSAFVDWQDISTNAFSSRMTLRPCKWIQPSLRYQLRSDRYISGYQDQENESQTNMLSNIYTFDVTVQPLPDLLTTGAYSKQDAWVKTGARFSPVVQTPTFNSGVDSWLFTAAYTLNPRTVLTSSMQFSKANNYNDISDYGLPLGADFSNFDVSGGLEWKPREDLTIAPKYAFYRYKPNEEVEIGGYTAHVIWLDVTLEWPFIKELGSLARPKEKKV